MSEENPDLGLNYEAWRAKLAEYRSEEKRRADFADLVAARERARPEMLELLRKFLDGPIDVEGLRSEFDARTRTEWARFGFKGPAGAMFLNMLVKHLPDPNRLTLPASSDDGQEKMRSFGDLLEDYIESKIVTRAQVQPARASFFLSGWWHVQAPEDWPIYYRSARGVLEERTSYRPTDGDPVKSYFDFREHYLTLAQELGVTTWEFEQLCAWLEPVVPSTGPVVVEPPPEEREKIWLFSPGPGAESWDEFYEKGIAAIGWDYLGDLRQYKSLEDFRSAVAEKRESDREPVNVAMACYQFAYEIQTGDAIYAKKGRNRIIGRGTVASDYEYDPSRESKKHVRQVKWDKRGEWIPRERPLVTKTLTEIGKYPALVRDIEQVFGKEQNGEPPESFKKYTLDHAVGEIFMTRSEIEDLLALLQSRKNVILQGPPGTGKSFIALRLAWLALGGRDSERLAAVQFHQSYSYEDFVQGYRPTEAGGFERRDGPFMRFCNLALQDQDNDYVLIIDEINRGNLSKILGELMMLIEPDKRDSRWATQLAYSTEDEAPFHVPPNLLIIGTMNTADRSLALVDYALRRRFAFLDVVPAFPNSRFQKELASMGVEEGLREQIVSRITELNGRIAADPSLGRGFMVGHSYFCQKAEGEEPGEEWLERIAQTEIAPLLREYWFEAEEKAEKAVDLLLKDA